MKEIDDKLIKIETDIAYLQDTVRELNEIVSSQQEIIMKLEKRSELLAKRLDELDTEARPNRRPPHY